MWELRVQIPSDAQTSVCRLEVEGNGLLNRLVNSTSWVRIPPDTLKVSLCRLEVEGNGLLNRLVNYHIVGSNPTRDTNM